MTVHRKSNLAGLRFLISLLVIGVAANAAVAQASPEQAWYVATHANDIHQGATAGKIELRFPASNRLQSSGELNAQRLRDLALSHDGTRLFAVTRNGILILDATTLSVVSRVETPEPHRFSRLALSPYETQAAVSDESGSVSFFNLVKGRFIGTSSTWGGSARGIEGLSYSPDGHLVYATVSAPSEDGFQGWIGFVLIFDARTHALLRSIETGRAAHHIVVTADGRRGYVSGGSSVTELDLIGRTVSRVLVLDSAASDMVMTKDERRAYVTGYSLGPPWLISVDLDTFTISHRQQLAGCGDARRLALAADEQTVAIAVEGLNALLLADLQHDTVRALRTGDAPFGIVSTPDPVVPSDDAIPGIFLSEAQLSCVLTLEIGNAVAVPGDDAEVEIRVDVAASIVAFQNDIIFDPKLLDLNDKDCSIEPAIGNDLPECSDDLSDAPCKELNRHVLTCAEANLSCGEGFVCPPECPPGLEEFDKFRALVLNISPDKYRTLIPSGVVYRCRFHVREDVSPGTNAPLICANTKGSTEYGTLVPMSCRDGQISIKQANSNAAPASQDPHASTSSSSAGGAVGGCQISQTTDRAPALFLLQFLALFFWLRRVKRPMRCRFQETTLTPDSMSPRRRRQAA